MKHKTLLLTLLCTMSMVWQFCLISSAMCKMLKHCTDLLKKSNRGTYMSQLGQMHCLQLRQERPAGESMYLDQIRLSAPSVVLRQ